MKNVLFHFSTLLISCLSTSCCFLVCTFLIYTSMVECFSQNLPYYCIHDAELESSCLKTNTKKKKKSRFALTKTLRLILTSEDGKEAVTWAADGQSIKILNVDILVSKILPRYGISRYPSFKCSLTQHGFKYTSTCIYHPNFTRDSPDQDQYITRVLKRKTKHVQNQHSDLKSDCNCSKELLDKQTLIGSTKSVKSPLKQEHLKDDGDVPILSKLMVERQENLSSEECLNISDGSKRRRRSSSVTDEKISYSPVFQKRRHSMSDIISSLLSSECADDEEQSQKPIDKSDFLQLFDFELGEVFLKESFSEMEKRSLKPLVYDNLHEDPKNLQYYYLMKLSSEETIFQTDYWWVDMLIQGLQAEPSLIIPVNRN